MIGRTLNETETTQGFLGEESEEVALVEESEEAALIKLVDVNKTSLKLVGVDKTSHANKKDIIEEDELNKKSDQERNTRRREFLKGLGKACAGIIAVSCGVTIYSSFISLGLLMPGFLAYPIAILLFCAVSYVNWLIYKDSVPEMLVEMFGEEILFKVLRVDCNKNPLTFQRKLLMGLGLCASFAVAIASGMLVPNGNGIFNGFIFLSALSPSFLSLTAGVFTRVFTLVTVVCLTALMFKNISSLIINPDLWQSFKDFFKELLNFETKTTTQFRCKATVINGDLNKGIKPIKPWDSDIDIHYYYTKPPNGGAYGNISYTYKDKSGQQNRVRLKIKKREGRLSEEERKAFRELERLYEELNKKDALMSKDGDKANINCDLPDNEAKCLMEVLSKIATNHPKVEPRSHTSIILEKSVNLILTLFCLPLAGAGVFMTIKASVGPTKVFLLRHIPRVSAEVADVVSKTLMLGLAFIGRIPFTIRNTLRTLRTLRTLFPQSKTYLTPSEDDKSLASPSLWEKACRIVSFIFCIINAIGNGLISIVGSGGIKGGVSLIIGAAGAWVSFATGVSAGVLDSTAEKKTKAKKKQGASPEKVLLKQVSAKVLAEKGDDPRPKVLPQESQDRAQVNFGKTQTQQSQLSVQEELSTQVESPRSFYESSNNVSRVNTPTKSSAF